MEQFLGTWTERALGLIQAKSDLCISTSTTKTTTTTTTRRPSYLAIYLACRYDTVIMCMQIGRRP